MELFKVFKDKKVLITGHTGFKGVWLSMWLVKMGAKVVGVSVDIPTTPSHFDAIDLGKHIDDHRLDIGDAEGLRTIVQEVQPDFVFHLAAQALVRPSYESPLDTLNVNVIGSANVLDALRFLNKKVVAIMITSDKAYDNVEWVWGYRETDRMGGKDPYSASKGMAELVIRSYVESFFSTPSSQIRVGITRAGNVIGGGDWAVDRIVPDCMMSWSKNSVVDIRSPTSTRPWQHVLEPLSGYLCLAAELLNKQEFHGEAFNFGPSADQNYPVSELIDEMKIHWDHVHWNDVSQKERHLHEAGLLKLNCDKALSNLNWRPALDFKDTVKMTINWYKKYYQTLEQVDNVEIMSDYTSSQIDDYIESARQRGLMWAK